jgi:hypothetical protein
MANEVSITITTEWFKEEPTLEPCQTCGDIMVSNTNCMYLFHGLSLLGDEPALKICNACCKALE